MSGNKKLWSLGKTKQLRWILCTLQFIVLRDCIVQEELRKNPGIPCIESGKTQAEGTESTGKGTALERKNSRYLYKVPWSVLQDPGSSLSNVPRSCGKTKNKGDWGSSSGRATPPGFNPEYYKWIKGLKVPSKVSSASTETSLWRDKELN